MEKNNTKCFDSIYDLLSSLFGDVQCTDSCKCKCHNHDTEEENKREKKTTDDIMLTFTDEDFKDEEKLNQYIDYLEDLRESFESNDNSIFSLAKVFGFDYNQVIDELIEHAEAVYDEAIEKAIDEAEESEADEKQPYTTQELAETYVKQVLAPTFHGMVSEKTQQSLIDSYKKFADWIIEQ